MTGQKLIVVLMLVIFSFAAGAYFLMNWQKAGTPMTSGPADGSFNLSIEPAPSALEPSEKAGPDRPSTGEVAFHTKTWKTQTAKVEPTETQKESGAQKPMAPELKIETPKQDTKNRVEPTIDVARVDPDGNAVFAGRSEPGWKVRIEAHGNILGETNADLYGEWVVVPDKPIPPGKRSLTLRAVSPSGTVGVTSPEKITVVVNREPKEKVIAEAQSPASEEKMPSLVYSLSKGPDDVPKTPEGAPSTGPQVQQAKSKTVVVRRGDTLWGISKLQYGKGYEYRRIYRLNRRQIRDPDLIYPRQRFKVR